MNMKTVTIRLTMMTDNVKNFVSLVNRYPYDMDLRSGRYVVDAKSILGIFSIDLSRPITMSIYSDDCDDLLKELDSYIVKDGEENDKTFIRSSRPPVRKMIFASSPPSSTTTSMSGMKRSTAPAVANTSWTNSKSAALATPSPAEPVTATCTAWPDSRGLRSRSISAVFSRTLDM